MKKLVLLLSALIMGLVLVSCEVTVTPLTDYIYISSSTSSMTLAQGEEKDFTLKVSSSIVIPNDSIMYVVKNANNIQVDNVISLAVVPFLDDSISISSSLTAAANATPGVYTVTVSALGATYDADVDITVTITGTVDPEITDVADVSVEAGGAMGSIATVANGSDLTKDNFTVSAAGTGAPTLTVTDYNATTGTVTIATDATNATAGTYTATLAIGTTDSETFTITVTLKEMAVKLYNPYAKDGFNSAYNLVKGEAVAGSLASDNTHMVYAASDSLVADIAVDNSLDIRATNVVAELTSINGGMFVKITKAEYDAVSTVADLTTLASGKAYSDNEVIVTDDDDIAVDGYFVMKLANSRGYAIVKMTELNKTDTEGSTGNTGYLAIAYKFTAM